MTSNHVNQGGPYYVSIAVFAWNEQSAISFALRSLLEQSVFEELSRRHVQAEIVCVANGCTDRTPEVATDTLRELHCLHPHKNSWTWRVANIAERGKINAWNEFVHRFSDREAPFLFMMDADILIHRKETLLNMLRTLEGNSHARVAVDMPRKDIEFKKHISLYERLSLLASRMTLAADGQLCAQLYCIRGETARRIYLPRDLAACEDGFIKSLVCTDFLSHKSWPGRIRVAPEAEHTFEAYTTIASILKNQKRQIIGQTIVHILVDLYLKSLASAGREDLAGFLRFKDSSDPGWIKKLIRDHLLKTRFCWRLYPELLSSRFKRLRNLSPVQRVRCLPAALAGSCATWVASFLAYRALKRGCTDYWPQPKRVGFERRNIQRDGCNTPAYSESNRTAGMTEA